MTFLAGQSLLHIFLNDKPWCLKSMFIGQKFCVPPYYLSAMVYSNKISLSFMVLWFKLIISLTYFFQVLINVCDQVVERSSKFLTQRSRPNSAKLITTSELCSMANLVELLNKESVRMTERVMPGLILSLQGLSRNELGTVWYNFYISRDIPKIWKLILDS